MRKRPVIGFVLKFGLKSSRLRAITFSLSLAICYWLLLPGCSLVTLPTPWPPAPTSQPPLTLTELPPLRSATPTPPLPDTGWQLLRSGLERRVVSLLDNEGRQKESLYLLRLDPAFYQFGVAYRPGQTRDLAAWQEETGALIVVNGGFFTEELLATGVIVVDGQASGTTYGDFAGMLAITTAGPELRWLREQPYDPTEMLLYALQSFPVLVKPGGQPGFLEEDGLTSRRTVIAQDRDGRLLFILAPWGSFTLHQLSAYLAASDLELDIALNLDGGTSTGLLLAEPAEGIPAFVPLPAVITVHPR